MSNEALVSSSREKLMGFEAQGIRYLPTRWKYASRTVWPEGSGFLCLMESAFFFP